MYIPEHFGYSADHLDALLARHRVADLVTLGPDGLEATLLPWTLHREEHGKVSLHAHLARLNRQWTHEGPALVILHGPDDYIGPEDVPTPGAVPTWDYITMHIRGRLIAHDDPEWTRQAMAELVAAQDSDWDFDRLPDRMLTGLVRSAVGVELAIESVTGKAKMSQNRSSRDIEGIADALAGRSRASRETVDFLRTESVAHARAREAAVAHARAGASPRRP